MKITLILDSKDSWFVDHAKKLQLILKKDHNTEIIYDFNEMMKGDIAFFLSVTKISPPEKLTLHTHNIVIHASDLPKGKGWSPMPWQIIEGKNEIVLSLFEAAEKVDSGMIYIKDKVVYEGHELIDELREKMAAKMSDMAVNYVEHYDTIIGEEQIGEETFYQKRIPQDSELDITKSLLQQFNLLRTIDNERYPAFFYKDGFKYLLKIYKES